MQQPLATGRALQRGEVEANVSENSPNGWRLVSENSWLSGEDIMLGDSELVIGRDPACHICLPGNYLSRQHATLRIDGNRLFIKDLNSTNGTFINGCRITQAHAQAGDKIGFDIYRFTLQSPQRPSDTPVNLYSRGRQATKQWKLAPTSPGNRTEPPGSQPTALPLVWIAAALCLAMAGTLAYLFLAS